MSQAEIQCKCIIISACDITEPACKVPEAFQTDCIIWTTLNRYIYGTNYPIDVIFQILSKCSKTVKKKV